MPLFDSNPALISVALIGLKHNSDALWNMARTEVLYPWRFSGQRDQSDLRVSAPSLEPGPVAYHPAFLGLMGAYWTESPAVSTLERPMHQV
jgi:hypothetical protein